MLKDRTYLMELDIVIMGVYHSAADHRWNRRWNFFSEAEVR